MQLPDVPLSARGREQAERVARRLAACGTVRHVLSSDLRRALETAEAVVRATGATLELDPGLRERDFGDVRGTAYAALSCDIFAPDYAPPHGETWAAFDARVDAAWTRVLARAAAERGDLVVVTHGLVCAGVVRRHCDLPAGVEAPVAWVNAALTQVLPPRAVALLACTAHLEATAGGGVV